jgi:tRNA threonylcarbamoyladenosine biosynthesis protein TsaB
MPSLCQLLDAHHPLLLLDAASARTQIGWFPSRDPAAATWATSDEESGIGVFRCIEQLGLHLGAARAFVFCEGPGSVLGIRTTAMAVRTWNVLVARPVFSFCSLAVVAHALGRDDLGVIADARRERWHHFQLGRQLRRAAAADLSGELVTPDHFRHWSPMPAGVTRTSYDLARLLPNIAQANLFQSTHAPDAFLHEEPSYATWAPHIHRAPLGP